MAQSKEFKKEAAEQRKSNLFLQPRAFKWARHAVALGSHTRFFGKFPSHLPALPLLTNIPRHIGGPAQILRKRCLSMWGLRSLGV
jgi:hypothetical protein